MTPVDRDIVVRKLSVIVGSLKALEAVRTMTGEQFARDLYFIRLYHKLIRFFSVQMLFP